MLHNKKNKTKICLTLFVLLLSLLMVLSACSSNSASNGSGKKEETEIDAEIVEETSIEPDETVKEETNEAESEIEEDSSAEEDEPVAIINLDVLKEIESKDTFDVKITKKELVEDAYSGISLEGNDACVLSITNNSSEDVSEVTIYTVAYTSNNGLKKLSQGVYVAFSGDPYVQAFTSEDITIGAGETVELGIKCRADEIAGVRAIVASYTTSNGSTYDNGNAEEWYKNVQVGKNTVLD